MNELPPTIEYRRSSESAPRWSTPARRNATRALFTLAAACLVLCVLLLAHALSAIESPKPTYAWDMRGVDAIFSAAAAFCLLVIGCSYIYFVNRIGKFSRAAHIVATVSTAIQLALACFLLVFGLNIFRHEGATIEGFVILGSLLLMATTSAIALYFLVQLLRQRD